MQIHPKCITEFTAAELQAELDRRNIISCSRPQPISLIDVNWSEVFYQVERMTSEIEIGIGAGKDISREDFYNIWNRKIMSLIIQAIYGDSNSYWEWESRAMNGY